MAVETGLIMSYKDRLVKLFGSQVEKGILQGWAENVDGLAFLTRSCMIARVEGAAGRMAVLSGYVLPHDSAVDVLADLGASTTEKSLPRIDGPVVRVSLTESVLDTNPHVDVLRAVPLATVLGEDFMPPVTVSLSTVTS